jgi:hypothetical protein
MALADFIQKLEAVWARLSPRKRIDVQPITTELTEDEAMVTAVITWREGDERKEVESYFRLQPSPYSGWDVVQTSLLDELLIMLP